MCTIFNRWENPKTKLPEPNNRVLVSFKNRNGRFWTAIAEHVPKHTVLAEDFVDPDCDPDWLDIGEDGKEYTPEGWYESTVESETSLMLDGEVMCWAYLPAKPKC